MRHDKFGEVRCSAGKIKFQNGNAIHKFSNFLTRAEWYFRAEIKTKHTLDNLVIINENMVKIQISEIYEFTQTLPSYTYKIHIPKTLEEIKTTKTMIWKLVEEWSDANTIKSLK